MNNSNLNSLEELDQRYFDLLATIAKLKHPSQKVQVMAVSKGQEIQKIRRLYQLGQTLFGENYAQELLGKQRDLADLNIKWSFIGKLQSNKIKRIVEVCSEIQTVTNLKHAKSIAKHSELIGKTPFPIFLEVNADAEATKNGVFMREALDLYHMIKEELPQLRIRGIMAIPSVSHQMGKFQDEIPEIYRELRSLADKIGEHQLSLGMSGDLKTAIRAGSNLVRIGTALMGLRS